MSKVTYRQADGSANTIEVPVGWSLMEAAMQNSIEGIPAECGGGCACATCHVYIDEGDMSKLPDLSDMEGDMLECVAAERLPGSRLSCQIRMTDELGDLTVTIPSEQF
jgi:2Fe-2S ferredoxin